MGKLRLAAFVFAAVIGGTLWAADKAGGKCEKGGAGGDKCKSEKSGGNSQPKAERSCYHEDKQTSPGGVSKHADGNRQCGHDGTWHAVPNTTDNSPIKAGPLIATTQPPVAKVPAVVPAPAAAPPAPVPARVRSSKVY